MKAILNQVEASIQSMVEGNIIHILGSVDAERELIRQFISEMESATYLDTDHNPVAPNYFSLNVPHTVFAEIRSNQNLLDKLAVQIMDAGSKAGLKFLGQVNIAVFPHRELSPGDFIVKAIVRDIQVGETVPTIPSSPPGSTFLPAPKAFFIVGGTKIFTIEEDIINIGRQMDNDLVINQPRISRKHAQVRQVKGRHMIFDLDSSGGTFVNNQRIKQIQLHPGDVISLAGIPLVYGHDSISSIADTEEYHPPTKDNFTATSTSATHLTQDDTDSQNLTPV
ncbi:MAG: DUF3662 domain-containing protein [Anaerolineales bacterium]|nr:DUF3662 domain-containing protein [Anaerolineales bacterium]